MYRIESLPAAFALVETFSFDTHDLDDGHAVRTGVEGMSSNDDGHEDEDVDADIVDVYEDFILDTLNEEYSQ